MLEGETFDSHTVVQLIAVLEWLLNWFSLKCMLMKNITESIELDWTDHTQIMYHITNICRLS